MNRIAMTAALLALLVTGQVAAGGGEHWSQRFLRTFESGEPITDFPPDMNLNAAYALQRDLVAALAPRYGRVVGYKAALTGPGQRQRMGIPHPVRGFLLEKTLYPDGSTVSADFGVAPFMEGDFIIRVGSAAINKAEDRMQVLAALDAVLPFIELVDLPVKTPGGINLPGLIAGNTGARKGFIGDAVAIAPTAEWLERLGNIEVALLEDGQPVSRGTTVQLYGHPVDAVIWLRDALAADGIVLKPGDLLSLGSVAGGMTPIKPGTELRAVYTGLSDAGPITLVGRLQ